MFETPSLPEARPIAILKKGFVVTIGALLIIGAISSYRAYVQVKSLEVTADQKLTVGSSVRAVVVGSGRTMVDVKVELIQGVHTESLMSLYLPGNELAFFDPRSQSTESNVKITADQLSRLQPGTARIRAVATGRHQWTRLRPPTVREIQVEIGADTKE